jgi:hypothetical protein
MATSQTPRRPFDESIKLHMHAEMLVALEAEAAAREWEVPHLVRWILGQWLDGHPTHKRSR